MNQEIKQIEALNPPFDIDEKIFSNCFDDCPEDCKDHDLYSYNDWIEMLRHGGAGIDLELLGSYGKSMEMPKQLAREYNINTPNIENDLFKRPVWLDDEWNDWYRDFESMYPSSCYERHKELRPLYPCLYMWLDWCNSEMDKEEKKK